MRNVDKIRRTETFPFLWTNFTAAVRATSAEQDPRSASTQRRYARGGACAQGNAGKGSPTQR